MSSVNVGDLVTDIEAAARSTIEGLLGHDWVSLDVIEPDDSFDKTLDFQGLSNVSSNEVQVFSGGKMQVSLTGEIAFTLMVDCDYDQIAVYRRECYIFWFELILATMSDPSLGVDHTTLTFEPGRLDEDYIANTGEDFVYSLSGQLDFVIERLDVEV